MRRAELQNLFEATIRKAFSPFLSCSTNYAKAEVTYWTKDDIVVRVDYSLGFDESKPNERALVDKYTRSFQSPSSLLRIFKTLSESIKKKLGAHSVEVRCPNHSYGCDSLYIPNRFHVSNEIYITFTSKIGVPLLINDSTFERTSDSVETEDLQEAVDEEECEDSNDFNLNELRELLSRLESKIAKYNNHRKFWDDERLDARGSDEEAFRQLENQALKVRKIVERLSSKSSSHKTTDSIEGYWTSLQP